MKYLLNLGTGALDDVETPKLGEKYFASAETDEIIKQINDQYGPGTLFPASEAPQPEIKTPQSVFEFGQRNPAADGGMMRQNFSNGTFLFKGNTLSLNIKGLTGRSIENIKNLLKVIEDNPNITPQEWFAKTSKVQGASSGLDQLARDLLKYVKGDTKNLSGAVSKEVFDKLKIKKLIKDEIPNLNKISGKVVRQTAGRLAAAKKAVTNTFEAVIRLNEEFKLDPDINIEELSEQLYGKGASKSVTFMNQTRNDITKYVEVLKTGTRNNLNIPNFKYPSTNQATEILGSIADKSGSFGFQEGAIRDLKFSIRDDLLNLKKGTTLNLRRVLSNLIKGKGNVIDEAIGLSSTFEDAPGYTEATQVIKNKINKQKANTIDKPFSALIKKIKTNSATAKEINDFNTISKRFMKETGVDSPIIKTGKNLNPEKFVKNFKDYSPEAQANIKKLAKENNFVIQTKSEPLKNVIASLKKNRPLKEKILSGIGKGAKVFGKVLKPLGYGVIGPIALSTAVKSAEKQGLELNLLDKAMAFESGDAEIALNNARRRVDPEFALAERAKDLAQMTDDFEEVGLDKTTAAPLYDFANGGRINYKNGSPRGPNEPEGDDFLNELEFKFNNIDSVTIDDTPTTFDDSKSKIAQFNDLLDYKNIPYVADLGVRTLSRIGEFGVRVLPATGKLISDVLQKPMFKVKSSYLREGDGEILDYGETTKEDNVKFVGGPIFKNFLENITPTSTEKLVGLDTLMNEEKKKMIERGDSSLMVKVGETTALGGELVAPIFPGLKILRAFASAKGVKPTKEVAKTIEQQIDAMAKAEGMSRREFLQLSGAVGTIGLAKLLGISSELPKIAKTAEAVTSVAKTADGIPQYLYNLRNVIRLRGKLQPSSSTFLDGQEVYTYKGVTLYHNPTSLKGDGSFRIAKEFETNSTVPGESSYNKVEMEVKTGEDVIIDEGLSTQKIVKAGDEYEEATAYPAREGGEDVDFYVEDDFHKQLEEISKELEEIDNKVEMFGYDK